MNYARTAAVLASISATVAATAASAHTGIVVHGHPHASGMVHASEAIIYVTALLVVIGGCVALRIARARRKASRR